MNRVDFDLTISLKRWLNLLYTSLYEMKMVLESARVVIVCCFSVAHIIWNIPIPLSKCSYVKFSMCRPSPREPYALAKGPSVAHAWNFQSSWNLHVFTSHIHFQRWREDRGHWLPIRLVNFRETDILNQWGRIYVSVNWRLDIIGSVMACRLNSAKPLSELWPLETYFNVIWIKIQQISK